MSRTRAAVHLGPIKSGTTALARYLTAASSLSALPEELIYPSGALWFGRSGAIVRQRDDFDIGLDADGRPAFRTAGVEAGLDAVAAELSRRDVDVATAFFIVETGSARLHPEYLVATLRARFDEVVVFSMARRQDRALTSIIAQRVKMWGSPTSLDPRDHVGIDDPDVEALAYDRVAERWTVPDSHYRLLPYLEGEQGTYDTIARIMRLLQLPDPVEVKGIAGRRIHPTFSHGGMQALAAIKRRAARAWLPTTRARLRRDFDHTIATYHGIAINNGLEPSGRKFQPWTLDLEDARWILDRFREGNERMLATVDRRGFEEDWRRWEKALDAEAHDA